MEQPKALNALEPFLALSKSAVSPRAAADLIQRATSAPNTFVFTELLETPQIQALASSPEFSSSLALLRVFSYGTYASLRALPEPPPLNDAQKLKLRQLSLLSLARGSSLDTRTSPSVPILGYSSLLAELDLSTVRELEELVISTIYAGLIHAQLDPKHELVRISNVAPLRDIAPGPAAVTIEGDESCNAIDGLLSSLQAWAGRCEATLQHLEEQMSGLRADADKRALSAVSWSQRMEELVEEEQKGGMPPGKRGSKSEMLTLGAGSSRFANATDSRSSGGATPATATASGSHMKSIRPGKRGSGHMDASGSSDIDDEAMDVDDDDLESVEGKKRVNKRKL